MSAAEEDNVVRVLSCGAVASIGAAGTLGDTETHEDVDRQSSGACQQESAQKIPQTELTVPGRG